MEIVLFQWTYFRDEDFLTNHGGIVTIFKDLGIWDFSVAFNGHCPNWLFVNSNLRNCSILSNWVISSLEGNFVFLSKNLQRSIAHLLVGIQ